MKDNQLTKSETKYLRGLAKKHILLPTKFKKSLVKNWNKYYPEYRSIEKLLELNQEYSLRTGTLIVNQDGEPIGEIHSKGRFIVGIGSIHQQGTRYRKKGVESIRNLELYYPKPKKISPEQKYCQKKEQLEQQIARHPQKENLNTCYICLVYFEKTTARIKSHLAGKQHQKN
ncbi:12484_t:CDS:2 [Entrophospora sp. SA101]|nr:6486_t:CDS:2 [Entrophospora sp. SA101]CAJ0748974.1 12484_t:CDS:2 [Entrophospora sp. SA101]CAJ0890357.1 10218_t:CDS:2 [Entrophospora sp. SA101]